MQFAITKKRKFRDVGPADWIEKVQSVEGVTIQGNPMSGRLKIEASNAAIEQIRTLLGDAFHVEEIQRYNRQAGD